MLSLEELRKLEEGKLAEGHELLAGDGRDLVFGPGRVVLHVCAVVFGEALPFDAAVLGGNLGQVGN